MGAEKGDNKQLQYKASTRKNDSILGKLGACCEKPHNERSISSPCCKPDGPGSMMLGISIRNGRAG
jgi:hypothetical protein